MQFMDSHIHLQDFNPNNATDIIRQAVEFGINKLVCVSAQEADWPQVAQLYEQFPEVVIPAFGLHPWYCHEARDGWFSRLEQFLIKYPNALVGEIGLDRAHNPDLEPQNMFFSQQLQLAKAYNRPMVLHAVKAIGWLDNYWHLMPRKFVFHSFRGNIELLNKIIKAGGYVSLAPSILRSSRQEIIKHIPLNKLLLETDAPFQGQPADILHLAKEVAALRGETIEAISTQIYQNSLEFSNVK